MKKALIWLGNVMLYWLGLSGVLTIILFFNQSFESITWLGQITGGLILLLAGGFVIYVFNHQYQIQQPDLLYCDWQFRSVVWAIFYGILLLLATPIYEQIRYATNLPERLPHNQIVLMELMQHAPLLLVVFAGLIAPIAEELLFRGLLFRFLAVKIRQPTMLILISAFLFALPHQLPNNWDFTIYMVMGCLIGLCYWHTKSLKYAILSHFINNAITLIIMWQS